MKDHDKDKCHTEQNNTSDQGKYYHNYHIAHFPMMVNGHKTTTTKK